MMVQMALQSRAVVPDGTASVSSVFIILQGEERERAIEREKVGERSGIQEPIKEPCLALKIPLLATFSPPLTFKSSPSPSLTSLRSFVLLLSPPFSPAQREGKTPYCY